MTRLHSSRQMLVRVMCFVCAVWLTGCAQTKLEQGAFLAAEIPLEWTWEDQHELGTVTIRDQDGTVQVRIRYRYVGEQTEQMVRQNVKNTIPGIRQAGGQNFREFDMKIDGTYARCVDFSTPALGKNPKHTYVALARNGYAYSITYGRPQAEQVVKSIKFKHLGSVFMTVE